MYCFSDPLNESLRRTSEAMMYCQCAPINTVTYQIAPSISNILGKRFEINEKTQSQLLHYKTVVVCWAATYPTQPQLQLLHNNPVMVCWQIPTLHSQIPFGAQLLNGKLAASNLTSHSVNIRSSRGVTSKNTAPILGWRM